MRDQKRSSSILLLLYEELRTGSVPTMTGCPFISNYSSGKTGYALSDDYLYHIFGIEPIEV